MPNRVIRDWTDSKAVNKLTRGAELFFVRLIMRVDDYGIYPDDPVLMKASLFPLLIESIAVSTVGDWLEECYSAGLLGRYSLEGENYVQITKWEQGLRRPKVKYPHPPADIVRTGDGQTRTNADKRGQVTDVEIGPETQQSPDGQTRTNADKYPPELETKRNRNETETKVSPAALSDVLSESFLEHCQRNYRNLNIEDEFSAWKSRMEIDTDRWRDSPVKSLQERFFMYHLGPESKKYHTGAQPYVEIDVKRQEFTDKLRPLLKKGIQKYVLNEFWRKYSVQVGTTRYLNWETMPNFQVETRFASFQDAWKANRPGEIAPDFKYRPPNGRSLSEDTTKQGIAQPGPKDKAGEAF